MLPAALTIHLATSEIEARLPGRDLMADGDLSLVLADLIDEHRRLVVALAVIGLALHWIWSLTWKAGLVRHKVWAGGRAETLAELIGHGIGGLRSFAAVSLTALLLLVIPFLALWWPLLSQESLLDDPSATPLRLYGLGASLALSLLLIAVSRSATLWSFWMLAHPTPGPAPLVWLRALGRSLKHPLRGPAMVLLAMLAGLLAGSLPLIAGWQLAAMRDGLAAMILSQLSGLVQAFVQVALFMSFEPVAAWLVASEGEPASPTARRRG
jgi:hypothetical protein